MDGREGFVATLQAALNRFYDPVFLRKSPLVELFGLAGRINTAEALRVTLETAIDALKSASPGPSGASSQRSHQVLYYRYVQQLTQVDVANKLAMSPRHLRREQSSAVRSLADYLIARYHLSEQRLLEVSSSGPGVSEDSISGGDRELTWLKGSLVDQTTDLPSVLRGAIGLAATLAEREGVALDVEVEDDLPLACVPQTVIKQIVLDLLTSSIRALPRGRVLLTACAEHPCVAITLAATADVGAPIASLQWNEAELDIAHRLTSLYKGRLTFLKDDPRTLSARVVLPSTDRSLVLAIEDNADTLDLWRRYVQSSSYRLIGVRDPWQAMSTAIEVKPQLIVLDVMMPGVDGWELLAQLRHHPATSAIPIIICTVHPQKALALALGASEFILKPTTRRDFRRALQSAAQRAVAAQGT